MIEEQKAVLLQLGVAVLMAQCVEQALRTCMTFVLQGGEPVTIEYLERLTKEERRKTLGFFLTKLRSRADLDPNFDLLLTEFLESRNMLVHKFDEIPGCTLYTPEGRAAASAFLNRFLHQTDVILKVFTGLSLAWHEQLGEPISLGDSALAAELETKYKPLVNQLFFEKKDDTE